jgi:diguanylate cyclase (GGDEF)-like protein/PAS domain S-box-containing protein
VKVVPDRDADAEDSAETLLDVLVDDVEDYAILTLDLNGNVATWNAGARRIKGYRAEEIIGRHFSTFYSPEEVAAGKPARELEIAAATGRLEDEGWRVRRDGTLFWANVVITALRDENGSLRGYGKITRDLTERRAAELALRSSEERFRLMVDGVRDYAILMLDVDGNVATWNAGAERFKGYRADEIIGRHFSTFYPSEDIAAGKPARELEIAAAEGRLEDEGWRLRRDGSRFWANVVITALRDDRGVLRGYGKITRDLTERRAAELALQASEERFRRSFDEARIGMMTLDLAGRYERINDAFCAMVGYDRERLIGKSKISVTHVDDMVADMARLNAAIEGESPSDSWEKRYIHASGHTVWGALSITLLRDVDGQPIHFIAQVQDITERREYETQLQHMADHDPLTGLLNRRSFERELKTHAARTARYGPAGGVLMIDLDNFKYFNDTQGHRAGDQLIVRVAKGLKSRLRDSDVLARLGGDEFAALLPRGDERAMENVADGLLEVVRNEALLLGGHKRLSASIGIARLDDGKALTPEEVMVNADLAMYDAKESGRNRWARYRTEQHAHPRIETRMKWAGQISTAIADDAFVLLAQPIVPLLGAGHIQYELLLRMRDRRGGIVPPKSFLPVAERLGLVGEIDRWVTGRAIDMLAEQRAAGRDVRFAVNLSGLTIGDEGLLELVSRRLRETGVPPDRLTFEVTESAAIGQMERAAHFARRLSQLGCSFALDDFGAGFGSFSYLKHLPFDYLKIDGEFVQHCAENETDRILISAVVQIAHGMGKSTIAEFVTDRETVEVLTRLGVDYGQGYYLGRPAPLEGHLAGTESSVP